ncbi:MAG: DUF1592 domain-containing protein [Pirellulaceae bacterium]|nr:DUF1592 domain-containing protein [Pirellulaceae bacterium]
MKYLAGRQKRSQKWILQPACLILFFSPPLLLAEESVPSPDVIGFLEHHCVGCHDEEDSAANLSLHGFADRQQLADDHHTVQRIRKMLVSGKMPPAEQDQPSAEEKQQLVEWLDTKLAEVDCRQFPFAGRPTLRRLNRYEYRCSIRDWLGVDFAASTEFPRDEVGHGFDNMGAVLSLSPLHLEKYMLAAETIVQEAIATSVPIRLVRRNRRDIHGGVQTDRARALFTNGLVHMPFTSQGPGTYDIRARVFASQAGDELAKMAIVVDDRSIHEAEVRANSNAPQTYETSTFLEEGKVNVGVRFLNDFYDPDNPDENRRDRNLFVVRLEIEGPKDPPLPPVLPDTHVRVIPCSQIPNHVHSEACLHEVLERLASRAFRRPLRHGELERLLQLALETQADGAGFEESVQHALAAILVSPHFLFRVEELPTSAAKDHQPHAINAYDLATRLSYFLWSSLPDEALRELAQSEQLHESDVLRAQAIRMLQDPRSQALVDQFAVQWLNLGQLTLVTPDPETFPEFDEDLRNAMLQESKLFFASVIRQDRSILDFLLSNDTWVNSRLARHYHLEGVTGKDFQHVVLNGNRTGGVLSHASVLTVTSNPTRTSAVQRGKWVLENLLGTPPVPPPPGIEPLPEDSAANEDGLTLRQRLESHRSLAECATCHASMDPLGFALENYNAIGVWRDQEDGQPIDAIGGLPDGTTFDGPKELQEFLFKKRHLDFCRCFTEKMLTYALGRGLQYQDQCTVDDIVQSLEHNGFRFSALIEGIVLSTPFRCTQSADNS